MPDAVEAHVEVRPFTATSAWSPTVEGIRRNSAERGRTSDVSNERVTVAGASTDSQSACADMLGSEQKAGETGIHRDSDLQVAVFEDLPDHARVQDLH